MGDDARAVAGVPQANLQAFAGKKGECLAEALELHVGIIGARFVGDGEVREDPVDFDCGKGKKGVDVTLECFEVETQASHAAVDFEMDFSFFAAGG